MPTYSKKLLPCHRAQWAFVHGTVPCTASRRLTMPLPCTAMLKISVHGGMVKKNTDHKQSQVPRLMKK